ncbi:MAG: phenylalanine--tRNA ligase subunit beta [Holosporaceae bacterium]|jgi:phenylalanyl-tRNA synthetase beta chain|nr:phenylalanine--tRNA ligase subunit beta [Holosporaceae bacterium]
MRFSFNWLKRRLSTDLNIQQIADKLTSIGLEVESVENPALIFKNFKLVRIKKATKHPDADNLQICVVEDVDGNEANIVCGAKNARAGLKTILAMPGAVIPSSKMVIKKSKIRGVVSEGMMCSHEELAISSQEDGIVEINKDTDLSTPIDEILGYDVGILEVSITPNRGDCLSINGIARDLAAAGAGKFLQLEKTSCDSSFKFPININYENSDSCFRYAPVIAFQVIRGVRNGESPQWLKSAIRSAGLNSISMLVDLSNFWMIDSGRPTHIYDLSKIQGDVQIRFAKSREIFEDVRGNEHRLLPDMLVAADRESPLCLLGIMGGKKTACDENTTDVLLESGLFDPIFISKTGTLLNLTSDSRTRFERGIDRDSCISGLGGITKLIVENCGGEVSDILVVGTQPSNEQKIILKKSKLDCVSGCDNDWNEAKYFLKQIGVNEIRSGEFESTFSVPSWRSDLKIEEDLIEEVLRLKGYDNIPSKSLDIITAGRDRVLDKKNQILGIKRILASRGLSEVITYSFTKQNYAEAFKENRKLINLINPISVDLSVMRPSLIPTLLNNVVAALSYGQTNIGVCESGNVFYDSCQQELQISGVRLGNIHDRNWLEKTRSVDVFDVKGDILAALDYCKIDEKTISIVNSAPSYYHPSRSGAILSGKKELGYFGELHPKIKKLFGITEKTVCFEIFSSLLPLLNSKTLYFSGKVFPKITRDFAFLFSSKTSIGSLVNAIYRLDPIIKKVNIFDCFDLNVTLKSIGVSITLEAADRTLTEEEAQNVSEKIIKYVRSIGGELRNK